MFTVHSDCTFPPCDHFDADNVTILVTHPTLQCFAQRDSVVSVYGVGSFAVCFCQNVNFVAAEFFFFWLLVVFVFQCLATQ